MMKHTWRVILATAAAVAATLVALGGAPAQAASFSYTDSSCSSFSVQDVGGGSVAVSCARIDCSIAPSVTAPLTNWNVILIANCSPTSATSYSWTKLNGGDATCPAAPDPGAATTLLAPNAIASACSYKLTAIDQTYGTATRTLTLNWGAVAAPSGCSITASPASLPSTGGTVTLTMNCIGGAATSYSWTGGFAQGLTSQQVSGVATPPANFSAIATNGGGSGSATTQITTDTGGGPPPGSISCPGFAFTHVMAIDWNNPLRQVPSGMGPNDAVVVQFTTGPNTSSNNGHIATAEWAVSSGGSEKVGALSTQPCVFNNALAPGAFGDNLTVTVFFSVGAPGGYNPSLQPNTTYYFNVKNGGNPSLECLAGNCGLFVDLIKPSGL